jgi:hypothetical protein
MISPERMSMLTLSATLPGRRWSTNATIEQGTTRIASDTTVRMVLFLNATQRIPSRASNACLRLSMTGQDVGSAKVSSADCAWSLTAVSRMNTKGITKTTTATTRDPTSRASRRARLTGRPPGS